ncbi:winged helix-turn-helix transcriptional regulator [Companilactobacillus mishanensis]|uniref:Helix-turn-helix transcriptional regulator n=1 Tax=Companilactobacillus mishanensis TaxID=2486008 RepID=A0A5P0ZIV6_9LACO|nr:helix-turn-helix domain-containing protein [Companilactobacillus mishanensis]MQS53041.1 helix-turn-helix transcriptional regulator [Companilactobacillus mishanensis]MQS89796.1 helix-turn-helix transcriptional regulator [Companilactobacillus mishanensis]
MAEKQESYQNGVLATLAVMGGKWKPLILCHMGAGPIRPAELRRVVPGISPKVLTDQLRELERDEIIERHVYNEVPPHVEYEITPYGKTLNKVLVAMSSWGEDRIKRLQDKGQTVDLVYPEHDGYSN